MTRIYPYVAGNTLKTHEAFLQKLTKRRAKVVDSLENSDVIIVFCPIVSRYKTDIDSAISSVTGIQCDKPLILVAMHHTFDTGYIFPKRDLENPTVILHVDCLFYEKTGLLSCSCNKNAIKMVRKQLNLKKYPQLKFPKKAEKKKQQKEDRNKKDLTNHE